MKTAALPLFTVDNISEKGILTKNAIQYSLLQGDALKLFEKLPSNSIHAIITDPPYFIDGMGDDWNHDTLTYKANKAGVIPGLPVGMKFDPSQGLRFEKFMLKVAQESIRVLKPGGFFISFSQARLYHRMAVAVENAGFEIRDMLGWVYEGQAKAFTQDHFVRKDKTYSEDEKVRIIENLGGRKTPQLKPCIEPMVMAQKPREGTFIENWLAHEVGLIDTNVSLDGKFPGNLMKVAKPTKEEKGDTNLHLTVKPTRLIEHLVQMLTKEGQTVMDPFTGSGSHGVAALKCGRKFIGFEIDPRYVAYARQRMEDIADD